jgi:CheY-like chemotaxis protein
LDDKKRKGNFHCTSPQAEPCKGTPQPTILLVEHRDEVFARLATDIAEFGIRVLRAKSAIEAMKLYDKHGPTLIVGNVDLPDQSGWLMTAKLRLFDRGICIWLYQRQPSNYGQEIAAFLGVDALLPYQGDLLSLSEQVIDLMDQHSNSTGDEDGSDRSEESTAA